MSTPFGQVFRFVSAIPQLAVLKGWLILHVYYNLRELYSSGIPILQVLFPIQRHRQSRVAYRRDHNWKRYITSIDISKHWIDEALHLNGSRAMHSLRRRNKFDGLCHGEIPIRIFPRKELIELQKNKRSTGALDHQKNEHILQLQAIVYNINPCSCVSGGCTLTGLPEATATRRRTDRMRLECPRGASSRTQQSRALS